MKYGYHGIVFREIIMKFIVMSSSYTRSAQIRMRYNLQIRSPACVRYGGARAGHPHWPAIIWGEICIGSGCSALGWPRAKYAGVVIFRRSSRCSRMFLTVWVRGPALPSSGCRMRPHRPCRDSAHGGKLVPRPLRLSTWAGPGLSKLAVIRALLGSY